MKLCTQFGIDVLLQQSTDYLDQRIALVCNQASVTSIGIHSRLALQHEGFNIIRLFAPEHGFDTKGVDGAYIDHQVDKETNIPIVSLYSEKLAPTEEDLADVDLILIDLPDIGARFYTYLWTMSYVLESASKYNKPVVILDRPNPMANDLALAEGPILEPNCVSFIGRFPIPITHHCTFGELALYFQHQYYPTLDLQILKMENWDRKENTGYNFFPTSPAIQSRDTIYIYPGACLFEGLNIHEGRETAHPFAQFGAPWIDANLLYQEASSTLTGEDLEIVEYISTTEVYPQEKCYGLRVIPRQAETFQSVQYFIQLIQLIDKLHPNKLTERNYSTNVNPTGTKHLDKLLGIENSFQLLKENKLDSSLAEKKWYHTMKEFLLY